MKSMLSWFLNIVAIMFWIFRMVVILCEGLEIDFVITSFNSSIEIPMLFITLACIVLIIKRNFVGGLIYFLMYTAYFLTDILNITTNQITPELLLNIIVSVVAIIISLANFLNIALSKHGKSINKSSKKTDWFYGNEKFDRQKDERADKNNYRIS